MMALDMGGPLNKAAYAFSVGLLASSAYTPMAAVMAAGMTPPLGLALATRLAPNRFTLQEREAGGAAAVLGLAFITEGAIPFAAKDPLRVIPCLVLGSAVAGGLSMLFSVNAARAPRRHLRPRHPQSRHQCGDVCAGDSGGHAGDHSAGDRHEEAGNGGDAGDWTT